MYPDRKRHKFTRKEKIALWQQYIDSDITKEARCPCCGTEPIIIAIITIIIIVVIVLS
jgi:hypothetical protein